MPVALLSRDEVVERLMRSFAAAAMTARRSPSCRRRPALGRSSLYHHFPDGKDDMVRAVLVQLERELRETVFDPLRHRVPPASESRTMVKTLDAYYRGGREACVLGNLVLGTSRTRFRTQSARSSTNGSMRSRCASRRGTSKSIARRRAEDAVLRIEGALILAGGMDDVSAVQSDAEAAP